MCKLLRKTLGTRLVRRIVSGVQMALTPPPEMAPDRHSARHSSRNLAFGKHARAHRQPTGARELPAEKTTPPRNTLALYIYTAEGTGSR